MIQWKWKLLQEMSPLEVYEIIQHREKIFVVEQNDVYLDADGIDLDAWHLMGINEDNVLIAYARVILPDDTNNVIKFGRLAVAKECRGLGYSRLAIEEIFSRILDSKYNNYNIEISAQSHLTKMYEKFGFESVGEVFNMGSIPHIKMKHLALK